MISKSLWYKMNKIFQGLLLWENNPLDAWCWASSHVPPCGLLLHWTKACDSDFLAA